MEKPAVVIDNGSCFCRAGFATEDQPRSVIQTAVIWPLYRMRGQKNLCKFSRKTEDLFSTCRPVKHGIITDWEAMELFWNHVFSCKLKVFSDDQVVYMTDSPSSPSTNREKMAEVLFESFGVPGLQVANTAFLSLCSTGAISGIVIEAGFGVSHTVALFEGETLKNGTYRLDIAGRVLSKHLAHLLEANHIPNCMEKEQVTQIKEKFCYVSLDFDRDIAMSNKQHLREVELPDGKMISLGKETFQCPEPLFQPTILEHDSPGLHVLAFKSIQAVPSQYREEVLSHVIFAGGTSMFKGFPERARDEIVRMCPLGYKLMFLASPGRHIAAWTGGAITASLSSSKLMVMTKEDYKEHGAFHVHEKLL